MKYMGRVVIRMALLVVGAVGVALIWNAFSPWGIPLKGQWDERVGVVTPTPSDESAGRILQTVEAAHLLWEEGAVFLDARYPSSYAQSHIKGAVSFSVYDFDTLFFDFMDRYPPETPFVIYCSGRLCDESHRLAEMLTQEGYTSLRVFADGIPAWVAMGLPVEGEEGE